jgi:UTP-glucose-1-phosphate uridylyltransferase
MKPTLFVLAAGMGSRYGGLKQLDGLGPNGETIMDYSIYDAIRAGFGKIVFVIRHSFHKDFNSLIVSRYRDLISIVVTFQEINSVPPGCTYTNERTKPWGTNHALLMGESVIKEPFAIINADDFYGRESFEALADFLRSVEGKTNEYCMIGYRLGNTVTDNGSVSRGICMTDKNGYLTSVVECTHIEKENDQIFSIDENGIKSPLEPDTPVSMNMWGFTPDYFEYSLESFKTFLKFHGQELKSEFYIPTVVNELVNEHKVTCKVLDTPSKWFGVTYSEDRPETVSKLNELIEQGVYPKSLFEE